MAAVINIQTAIPLGPAGDPCSPQPDACVFFSPDSESPISSVFDVLDSDEPLQILAFDLKAGDSVSLEMVWGAGGGEFFAPVTIAGLKFAITHPDNMMVVPTSGRFRLVFTGEIGEATVVCQPTNCCAAQVYHSYNQLRLSQQGTPL